MIFFTVLIFAYTIFYPPFFSISDVDEIRILLEAIVLICLAARTVRHGMIKLPTLLVTAILLVLFVSCFVSDNPRTIISSFNKIAFFLLFAKFLKENKLLSEQCRILWVLLWTVFSVLAFLLAMVFYFKLLQGRVVNSGDYEYLSFSVLGMVGLREMFGFELGRVVGYMCEPSLLAYFFGFNVFFAQYLVKYRINRNFFIFINLVGGMLTFSITFYFLVIAIFMYKMIFHKRVKNPATGLIFFAVILFILSNTLMNKINSFSSMEDRAERFNKGVSGLKNSGAKSILLGSGIGGAREFSEGPGVNKGKGISNGFLNLLAERGLLLLIFMVGMFYKYVKYDILSFIYVMAYNSINDVLWFPIFYLGLAICYSYYYHHCRNNKEHSKVVGNEYYNVPSAVMN